MSTFFAYVVARSVAYYNSLKPPPAPVPQISPLENQMNKLRKLLGITETTNIMYVMKELHVHNIVANHNSVFLVQQFFVFRLNSGKDNAKTMPEFPPMYSIIFTNYAKEDEMTIQEQTVFLDDVKKCTNIEYTRSTYTQTIYHFCVCA